jgi:hypothetical protein
MPIDRGQIIFTRGICLATCLILLIVMVCLRSNFSSPGICARCNRLLGFDKALTVNLNVQKSASYQRVI